MKKLFKKLFILSVIILFIVVFSSSYFSLSMDNLAYVLAIGIDKSDENRLQVSFQFSTTSSIGESGGSTSKVPTVVNTVNASSLSTAINLMNSYLGKQVNMSHCKVIVFSEEVAKEGISAEIYTLINDTQIRPSANIIVSKTDSKYYIEKTEPELESLVSKYYEILTNSSKYTGFMPDATVGDFFTSLVCKYCSPYAILGGVTSENSKSVENSTMPDSQKDYNIKANNSALVGNSGSENIGVAVFNQDTLVGELNAIETISFLTMRNEADRFLVSVPNPTNSNEFIDIYLTPFNNAKVTVNTKNGSPYIKVSVEFTGRIYSMDANSKYLDTETLDSISQSCNSYLETSFLNYLYKTSKDFNADINGFGKYALSNFFTTQDFEDYGWLDIYQDAFFDVDVSTSVKSSMLITES